MGKPETNVSLLCKELSVSRQTLYRHLGPDGKLRDDGITPAGNCHNFCGHYEFALSKELSRWVVTPNRHFFPQRCI